MAYQLLITLDEDMDRDDAAMIAEELQDHDGVADVEGYGGWNPWEDNR